MKILIINYEFPPVGGGAGDVSYNLAKEFARAGHQVKVLTVGFKGLPPRKLKEGFEINRFFAPRKKLEASNPFELFFFAIFGVIPTLKTIKKFKPDLIHGHSLVPVGILCLLADLISKTPYVLTLHGGDAPGAVSSATKIVNLLQRPLHPLNKIVLHRAKIVTVVSNNLGELIQQSFPEIHTIAIPNGVDTNFFTPKPHQNLKFIFAYCGRLSPEKGIWTLYEAVKFVNQSHPRQFLVRLIGDGPLREVLEEKIKEDNLEEVFEFTGWVDKEKVRDFLQTSDVFVLPSFFEAWPTVLMQALACGLPAVVSDLPYSQGLTKRRSFLHTFKVGSAYELALALEELGLDREKLEIEGRRAREVAKLFSWNRVALEYLKVF